MGELDGAASYRDVFAVGEFRLLWLAQILSRAGDQLAAVSVAVLVYSRTGSPLLSASSFAATFLPWLVGGPFLSGLADRLPHRRVLVACDVVRALLVGCLAVPGMPLPMLFVLLFAVSLADPPFTAARAALLPEVLPGDRYVVGSSVVTVTNELAQMGGFAVGGVVVAWLGTHGSLALDGVTYLVSAGLLLGLRRRSAAAPGHEERGGEPWHRRALADMRAATRLLSGDPWLRRLTVLAWLCAFYVVPEALAVVYAVRSGAGPSAAGLLLAANPLGTVAGSVWLGRFVSPERRLYLMTPLAVASCLPLALCLTQPAWPLAGLLFLASGVGSAYNLPANAAFVLAVPAPSRGQAFGLVGSGMAVGQGVALVFAGAAAEVLAPGVVIAIFGAVGTVVALLVTRGLRAAIDERHAVTA